ncbi:hypothetical protein TNIN_247431 [Trichonephila inaurata madagascariensis]|uniref:Uncharacterized protein n=1 Tax=Trichonephila inaurata madagascariensis TaxID=2747483 RepID=A0A8X6WYG6_9ARAC|nr:hypothetical protein TNIN_247431 [Trichonephila inaurata madagascariensis]
MEERECLTLEGALEYFLEIDDDISESSTTDDNEQSDFNIISPDSDELMDKEHFYEDTLDENLEILKNIAGKIEIISKECRVSVCEY